MRLNPCYTLLGNLSLYAPSNTYSHLVLLVTGRSYSHYFCPQLQIQLSASLKKILSNFFNMEPNFSMVIDDDYGMI